MGSQLRWLEHTPDKREVGGSSPLEPTTVNDRFDRYKAFNETEEEIHGKEESERAEKYLEN